MASSFANRGSQKLAKLAKNDFDSIGTPQRCPQTPDTLHCLTNLCSWSLRSNRTEKRFHNNIYTEVPR